VQIQRENEEKGKQKPVGGGKKQKNNEKKKKKKRTIGRLKWESKKENGATLSGPGRFGTLVYLVREGSCCFQC